jgi:hypothetical protein
VVDLATRRPRAHARVLAVALPFALVALTPPVAFGKTVGIAGYSGKDNGQYCSSGIFGCHTTTAITRPPTVRFEGPTQVDPGATATYRFVVTSGAPDTQFEAGLDVAASAGTLAIVAGEGEQLKDPTGARCQVSHTGPQCEITHTGPKDNDLNNEAAWQFTWQAPDAPGEYVLFGAGNSVNANGTADGDQAAITMLMITVGNVPPSPTPTVTPAAPSCAGDCNGNGVVTVNELIIGVAIATGNAPVTACLAFDLNGNGIVSVNELVAAVGKALNGC